MEYAEVYILSCDGRRIGPRSRRDYRRRTGVTSAVKTESKRPQRRARVGTRKRILSDIDSLSHEGRDSDGNEPQCVSSDPFVVGRRAIGTPVTAGSDRRLPARGLIAYRAAFGSLKLYSCDGHSNYIRDGSEAVGRVYPPKSTVVARSGVLSTGVNFNGRHRKAVRCSYVMYKMTICDSDKPRTEPRTTREAS